MSGDLLIRPARPTERAALEALQRRASLAWEDYREALLAHPDAIDLPANQIAAGQVLVAENGGEILGFSAILPRPDGDADLDGLFVEPDRWRKGVGRRLVAAAERLAVGLGAEALHVVGNPRAEGFYHACGFVTVGEAPTRFGPALSMRKMIIP